MSNPVVLITGALTGIGRATAVAFAEEGARIVVAGRRDAEGNALEAELRGLGTEAFFIKADVRHDDEVRDLVVRQSPASAASTRPSTPPGRKASPVR